MRQQKGKSADYKDRESYSLITFSRLVTAVAKCPTLELAYISLQCKKFYKTSDDYTTHKCKNMKQGKIVSLYYRII